MENGGRNAGSRRDQPETRLHIEHDCLLTVCEKLRMFPPILGLVKIQKIPRIHQGLCPKMKNEKFSFFSEKNENNSRVVTTLRQPPLSNQFLLHVILKNTRGLLSSNQHLKNTSGSVCVFVHSNVVVHLGVSA